MNVNFQAEAIRWQLSTDPVVPPTPLGAHFVQIGIFIT